MGIDQQPLSGRTVAITGGSRGIGLSIGQWLAARGARIAIAARQEAEIDSALSLMRAAGPGPHTGQVCDVSQSAQLKEFRDHCSAQLGEPYALVAAAGVYGEIGSFLESSIESWEQSININLLGVIRSVRVFGPAMAAAGRGRIILFSGGGQGPMKNFAPYVTAKGGLWRFTETVGAELAEKGVFLNAIAPGAINTKFLKDIFEAGPGKVGKEFFDKSLKQKESGGESPEKAARLVEFLLSEKSTGLFGRTLSAVWDDYESLKDLQKLSTSDQFAYRRVVNTSGGTRA